MLYDRNKKENNVVEMYWNSLECTIPDIQALFDGLISEFNLDLETEEPYENSLSNIIQICQTTMIHFKDTTKMSQVGINKSLIKCFEVEKKATWALHSGLQLV